MKVASPGLFNSEEYKEIKYESIPITKENARWNPGHVTINPVFESQTTQIFKKYIKPKDNILKRWAPERK